MVERKKLVAMVMAVQNGDDNAITQLYETFQSDIYYFIFKTVNNDRELAEDLTQDTFIEILETIHKLEEPAAFVTWSKQIAYHKCTAYFRKRKDLLVDENEDGYSVFDTIEEDREEFIPDAALDHEDLKETIMAMIRELPEEQRSAIILRYFNEISVKEIAEIQGVTEGTVKSRLNYGRKAIKQSVEEYEKKNDVKLHCAGVLPLMLWFFRQYRAKNDLSLCVETATQEFIIAEETAAAATIIATVGASAGAVATASTGTAATVSAAAGVSLTTKIAAGVLAAVVAIGGVAVGVTSITHDEESIQQPTIAMVEQVSGDNSSDTNSNVIDETTVPDETPTEIPDISLTEVTVSEHQHAEVEVGPYTYVYCSYVETPYSEGNTTYYPYKYYRSGGVNTEDSTKESTEAPVTEHIHNYETHIVTHPTTECGGYTEHICACGDSYKDSYVERLETEVTEAPTEAPTEATATESVPAQTEHRHVEVVVGPYTYVYCSDVETPYREGNTMYYPYSYYT